MSGTFFISWFPVLLPLMAKRSLSPAGNSSAEETSATVPLGLPRPRPPITPPPLPTPPTAAHQSTPRNNGASSQLDHDEHHKRSDVDQYVDEDLRSHRVYLPTDIFLNVLLGVPEDLDSNEEFQKIIKSILVDPAYVTARAKYSSLCRLEHIPHENLLYDDYIGMCNAASSVIAKADSSPSDLALWAQNCGREGNLPPDLLAWAHGQLWHDLKRFIALLDNGSTAPYVVLGKDGTDPRDWKKLLHALCKYEKRTGKPPVYSNELTAKTKRYIQSCTDDLSGRPTKRSRTQDNIPGSDGNAVALPTPDLHPKDDADERHAVSRQCARYALETLSSGGFRSHSFGMLVGRNELQVLYYDRSVIAVCQPFKMFNTQLQSGARRDLDEHRFIAMLICQQRASLVQRGIMASLMPDPFLEVYSTYRPSFLFAKRQIRLLVNNKPVLVTLGRILMRQPGIIGRNTCVLEASSPEWEGLELIVKISWLPSSRVAENVFIDRIVEAAADAGDDAAWVLDHIPTVLHSQDFSLSEDSPGTRLRDYFEHDGCRVSVHERLYPVDDLKTCSEVAQVLFDVLQVHRWIYDHPRIIHRDMSMGNIMWHRRRNRVCGVLNDFDLSSFRDSSGASSKQRTGTRPFMAHELHEVDADGQPPRHIYRHELESLFYITTIICCGHELQYGASPPNHSLHPLSSSPYQSWFSMTDGSLHAIKHKMMSNRKLAPKPHRSFSQFRDWLLDMYAQFFQGIGLRTFTEATAFASERRHATATIEEESDDDFSMEDESDEEWPEEPEVGSFDEATLGGFVTYAAFFKIMSTFGRHKRGGKNGVKTTTTSLDVMYPEAKED
ncbi:hypothetical protein BDZ89DRAFT_1253469 [Hymenopellis radicata]|nr:hypothetical protein BDZ89DRAFT_1253469 [Hymenopellis radicata]